MRNQLAAYSALLTFIIALGLLALSGSVLLAATPLLLCLLAADLFRQPTRISVSRDLSASRVGPSTAVEVTVTVVNEGGALREVILTDRVPPGLTVVDGRPTALVTLRPGAQFSFSYSISGDRGSFEFDLVLVEVAGDFPLRKRRHGFSIPQELVTLPDHRALSRIPIAPRRTLVYAGSLPARRGGEGTEFFDVRLHAGQGEPRRINWRLSARRPGELYVNEFQEERVADIGIILDARLRAYPSTVAQPLFEYAANAAASLADVLLDQGNRVGFLAYGISIDWTAPGFGKVQKQRILTRIARVSPGESSVFFKLDEIPDRLLPGGSQLILVSPLTPDDAAPIIRLTALRYAVLVVSPDPISYQAAVAGMACRIARAERLVLIHRLKHAGIPVVDWDTRFPFETAVSGAIGQIQSAWRRRSR
ncbi:MAG: DUF58 domain-containing protein [Spirochaetales bacterium]|nr:DUF58 domain-containing protein [Spirochaetales bacterium]